MNDHPSHTLRHLWTRNLAILLAEFALLAVSITAAFIPMNGYNTLVNVSIAGIMALIGLLFFMDLLNGGMLLKLTASAGFFFVVIMFLLTLADYFTRFSGPVPAR